MTTAQRVKWDYQWITPRTPENPDDWSALATPRVMERPSNRRKKGKWIRKPVVAVEPAANRMALTVPETAWLLNCSPNTVWGMVRRGGELASFNVGSKRLVARKTIDDFIAQRERTS